jgi:putative SOS response-associated peptidase YedK
LAGPLSTFLPSWNVAPTQQRPVIRRHPDAGDRRLDLLTWGLVPHFTKDLKAAGKPIDARAETWPFRVCYAGPWRQRR